MLDPLAPGALKVKVGASWVDVGIWWHDGTQWVQLNPPGAVSPTTSKAIPAGAVNDWGTAADMVDSIGVNVHCLNAEQSATSVIAWCAEMGVRHIRDGTIPSWNSFWACGAGGRQLWVRLRQRNRALPAPTSTDQGHPVFLCGIVDPWGPTLADRVTTEHLQYIAGNPDGSAGGYPTSDGSRRIADGRDFTPDDIMDFFGGGHVHYDGNAGPTVTNPYVGQVISNSGSINLNSIVPNPWPAADPECPWEIMSSVTGPNEPGTGGAGVAFAGGPYGTEANDLSPWVHSLKLAKDAQSGTGYGRDGVTLSGNSRVVTEDGLTTAAPQINQIPLVGYVVMNYDWVHDINGGTGQSSLKDCSAGSAYEVDVGDMHPYNYAEPPSEERKLGSGTGYTGLPGYFNYPRDIYNGSQYPTHSAGRPPDPNRALPTFHTEWGLVQGSQPPYDATFGSGPWAIPPDAHTEYNIRQVLMAWRWGVRRTYIYQLKDNDIFQYGFVSAANVKRHQFYGMRNLIKLIGFSEPATDPRKLTGISVSGYSSSPANVLHRLDGSTARQTAKRLATVQIQQTDDAWLLVLIPSVWLYDYIRGNRNGSNTGWQNLGNPTLGRVTPATETLTITLPAEIAGAQVAWPTRGLVPSGAASGWPDPNTGLTWDALTITANQIQVPIDRYTKLVKLSH